MNKKRPTKQAENLNLPSTKLHTSLLRPRLQRNINPLQHPNLAVKPTTKPEETESERNQRLLLSADEMIPRMADALAYIDTTDLNPDTPPETPENELETYTDPTTGETKYIDPNRPYRPSYLVDPHNRYKPGHRPKGHNLKPDPNALAALTSYDFPDLPQNSPITSPNYHSIHQVLTKAQPPLIDPNTPTRYITKRQRRLPQLTGVDNFLAQLIHHNSLLDNDLHLTDDHLATLLLCLFPEDQRNHPVHRHLTNITSARRRLVNKYLKTQNTNTNTNTKYTEEQLSEAYSHFPRYVRLTLPTTNNHTNPQPHLFVFLATPNGSPRIQLTDQHLTPHFEQRRRQQAPTSGRYYAYRKLIPFKDWLYIRLKDYKRLKAYE